MEGRNIDTSGGGERKSGQQRRSKMPIQSKVSPKVAKKRDVKVKVTSLQ